MGSCSLTLSSLFFFSILLSMPSLSVAPCFFACEAPETEGVGRRSVPGMFVFGDSLVDAGNNNHLPSFARSTYFPYGIDFPGCPTGRFSNGYTIVDEIAKLLGLPLIPPNSQTIIKGVFHGVNYASAAAGILDETGRNFVARIPLNQQIKNFEATLTLAQIASNVANIGQCMFFVGIGSNDYLNNYLLPNYDTRLLYNGEQFANLLVQHYIVQLKALYNLGARKFMISSVGPLGCTPSILATYFLSHCSSEVNNLAILFNDKLMVMVKNLNSDLLGAKFIYIDIFGMFLDILNNSEYFGFTVTDRGCCGVGLNHGQITCLPCQIPCINRDEHTFWDAFHPTEAVNIILARSIFNGNKSMVYPMNVQQLATLNLEQS